MSLLKNLATDASIADERDSVGGGGPLDQSPEPAGAEDVAREQ